MNFFKKSTFLAGISLLVTSCGGGSSVQVLDELPYFENCGTMQSSFNAKYKKDFDEGVTSIKYDFSGFDASRKPVVVREELRMDNNFNWNYYKLKNPRVVCSKGTVKKDAPNYTEMCTSTNIVFSVDSAGNRKFSTGSTPKGSSPVCFDL